jgi:hypothetical protein
MPPSSVDASRDEPVSHAAGPQRVHVDASNATRYLCVGAQIDSNFGHQVLRETLEQRHRSIAPSFGFDLAPVVLSALGARRRRMQRDMALILVSSLNLVANPAGTIVAALSWLWVRFVYRSTRRRRPERHHRHALSIAALAYLVVIPVLIVIWLLVAILTEALAPLSESPGVLLLGPVGALFRSSRLTAAPFILVD